MFRAVSWRHRPPGKGLLAGLGAVVALLMGGCGSGGVTLPPLTTAQSGSGGGTTAITVSGALSGTLASPGGACVDNGAAGVEVTIQGTLGGGTYVLKFNAPRGTTNLATATSADIVVVFAPLQGGANWGADPHSRQGSGTLVAKGASGGRVNLHLVAGTGSSSTAPLDISGTYGCSSSV